MSLNPEYLAFGRIAIERAVGVMPDGTTFRIPQEDHLPDAPEVTDASLVNQIVYLAVPLRCESLMEINWPEERGTGRYVNRRLEVRDVHSVQGDTTTIDVSCAFATHAGARGSPCVCLNCYWPYFRKTS